jgi:hypothetical protein
MELYAGLEVSLKRTEICVVDGAGGIVWRGRTDTHPERIADALGWWRVALVKAGLETGSTTPWLARGLRALGFRVVVMEARRAADALKGRPVKTDRADARALAEMLQTGWVMLIALWYHGGFRRVGAEPPAEGAVAGTRPTGEDEAPALRRDPGRSAPVRDPAAGARGDQAVRRGGARSMQRR